MLVTFLKTDRVIARHLVLMPKMVVGAKQPR